MWVHPDHRHRELGEKLVDNGFAWARKNDASNTDGDQRKILLLEVYRSNEKAIALYQRVGFQQVPGPPTAPKVTVRDTVWMVAHVESPEL